MNYFDIEKFSHANTEHTKHPVKDDRSWKSRMIIKDVVLNATNH